ncbi:MAG TPA: 3-dehydroquinate synthase [Balneolaceae bacterium]
MSQAIEVAVSLKQQYKIYIGSDLEKQFVEFCSKKYSSEKVVVLIDENVNRLHGQRVEKMCRSYFDRLQLIEIPEGERSKSFSQWQKTVDQILVDGVERGTPLLAVGGGVTGDLSGFVASSVLRGIPLIHMPTTLLAMVDSSIGGKTGINHDSGKNLIGAFYQPDAVFADLDFLETLAQKEWVNGMAEILKYAAIQKPSLFDDLEKLAEDSLSANEKWMQVIAESARIKVKIVQEDALEAGKRAFLNFGHTFGHAIEKAAGYGKIAHGEAVFAGMIAAAHFSKKLGFPVDDTRFSPFKALYRHQMQPLPNDIGKLVEIMKSDKKVKNNALRLVLLNDWGSPYIYKCEDLSKLHDAWQYTLTQFN